jgi:hypothetical protein
MLYKGGDLTPSTLVSLRIDNDLLEHLKQRAEEEHRSLSNMIVSVLDDSKRVPPCYSQEDIEKCFAKIGAYLSAHANDDEAREIYWQFVKTREACYPIIYPEKFLKD